jgi:hypothetical protein
MASRTVTFTFDPGVSDVTAEDVVRAIRTVFGSAADLSEWQIRKISLQSPMLIEARVRTEVYKPVASFARRINGIQKGRKSGRRLTGVHARILDSIDSVTQRTFGAVSIRPAGEPKVSMNRAAIDHVRHVTGQMKPTLVIHRREQPGRLRGYLEQISAPKGQRARFAIRDRVTNDLIQCQIAEGEETLFKRALELIKKRVVVSGLIHFGERSKPTSILAQTIDPVDEHIIPFDELPKLKLTDDGDAVGYVRRLRDA